MKKSGKLLFAGGFVLFLNLFFFREIGSLGFALLFILSYLFLFINFKKDRNIETVDLAFFLLTVTTSIGIVIKSGGFVQFLLTLFTILFLFCYSYIKALRIPFVRSMFEVLVFQFSLAKIYLSSLVDIFRKSIEGYDDLKHAKVKHEKFISNIFSVGVGLAIGIPIVLILLALFYSADPIFASYVTSVIKFLEKMLTFNFPKEIGERLLLSVFLFFVLLPLLGLRGDKKLPGLIQKISSMGLLKEISIAGMMVGIILGLFLIVQWSYIFVNVPYETDLSRFHVATFSEYVNRGFWELIIASCIIYSLVWLMLVVQRDKKQAEKKWLMTTSIVILSEFAIFLVSMFRRIYLYQDYHGWSLARIYGGLFLIWLTTLTFFLAMRFFSKRKWIYAESVATVFIILLVSIVNFEKFLVQVHPPTVNKNTDYVYLANLSPDGLVGWEKAYQYVSDLYRDNDFTGKEKIDREDRRKIAYSGHIIRRLSKNYNYLINRYGSIEELKNYFNRILPLLIQNKREETRNAAVLLTLDNFRRFVYVTHFPWKISFELGSPDFSQFYDVKYWDLIKDVKGKKNDPIDILLSYNYAEYKAYLWFMENRRGESLFLLQDEFKSLYKKIAGQKEGEREYDLDISFSTPFID